MPTLGHAIRARRLELGLTLAALSLRTGCAKGYLSQIENGRRHHAPSEHLLRRLAQALDVEFGWLTELGRWDRVPLEYRATFHAFAQMRHHMRQLLSLVEKRGLADAFHSGELAAAMEVLIASEREASGHAPIVPSLNPPRIPILNRDGEFVTVPDIHDPRAFAIRITTESMAPVYRAGDVVIFSPTPSVPDGSDCFIRFAREEPPAIARVFFGHDAFDDPCLRLQPLNIAYPARTLRLAELVEMHPAVCVIRGLKGPSPSGRGASS